MRKIVLDKEKLKDLYVQRKLSLVGCGEVLGCTWWPVRVNLADYGIRVRTNTEHFKGVPKKNKINIDREKLQQLYLKQGLSTAECGKVLGYNPMVIYNRLKDYKIPTRKNGWELRIRGENHPNWKGGVILLIDQRFQKLEWKNLRKEIYRRDNWVCQVSGEHCNKNIQCHHIIPVREGGTDTPGNLTTLSKVSHGKIEHSKCQSFWRYYLSKHIKISLN